MIQGSQEWLEMRKNYIGASDAPVILKVSPWKTPYQLWQEKLGLSEKIQETPSMRYGKQMEEPALRLYEKYTGIPVSNDPIDTIRFHKTIKYMMASLDGICLDSGIPVEIKTANAVDHDTAKSGKIPAKYYPQLQHIIDVLDAKELHYFSFRDNNGVLVEVERDDKFIEHLRQEEWTFWQKVLDLETPSLTENDYANVDILRWHTVSQEWIETKRQLEELEKKEKECRQALIYMANGRNSKGNGIAVGKITRKGAIDYKAIPELEMVDLEKYRKPNTESWRITEM